MHLVFIGLLAVVGGVCYLAAPNSFHFKTPSSQLHSYQEYPNGYDHLDMVKQ